MKEDTMYCSFLLLRGGGCVAEQKKGFVVLRARGSSCVCGDQPTFSS